MGFMLFEKKHSGKWVATKGKKVVDSSKSIKSLIRKVSKRKDQSEVRYSLVPKGCVAGITYGV